MWRVRCDARVHAVAALPEEDAAPAFARSTAAHAIRETMRDPGSEAISDITTKEAKVGWVLFFVWCDAGVIVAVAGWRADWLLVGVSVCLPAFCVRVCSRFVVACGC